MKLLLGPMVRELAVKHYARFGVWGQDLLLRLRGAPVPPALVNEGVIARAKELADQATRDARQSGLLPEEEIELAAPAVFHVERRAWAGPDMSFTCGGCGQKKVVDGHCTLCGKVKF